jgi:hypothetical protein
VADAFPTYVLEIASSGLKARVLFNDWPAHRLDDGQEGTDSVLINPMVLAGKNRLRVLLEPIAVPDDVPKKLKVRLVWVRSQEDRTSLLSYSWNPESYPLHDEGMTDVFRQEIDLMREVTFGSWAWEGATPYMDKDRPAVLDALAGIRAAVEAKDVDSFLAQCDIKIEELARATNRPAADVREAQKRMIGGLIRLADVVEVAPLAASDVILESCAHGRLLEVFGPGYTPPIRIFFDGDEGMQLPLTMSNIGGQWRVVR